MMLNTMGRLMSDEGRRKLHMTVLLASVSGVGQGLAMVCLLPAATALASGQPSWGLGLWSWIVVLALLAVISAVAQYGVSMSGFQNAFHIMYSLSEKIGDRIATLPLGWFRQERVGEVSQLAAKGIIDLGQMAAHLLSPVYQHGASTVVLALGAWFWDWRLGLLFTLAVPALLLLLWFTRWLGGKAEALLHPAEVEVNNRVLEFSRSQGALRACGRSRQYQPLDRAITTHSRKGRKNFWILLLADGLGACAVQLVVVSMIMVTGWLAISQLLSPVEALVMVGLSLRYGQPLEGLFAQALGTRVMSGSLARAKEVLDSQPLPTPSSPNEKVGEAKVEFERVAFSYGDAPVFRDVSFRVPGRSMTALVGPSGSGKTTAARLIARFYDVDSGTVRVGGVDVRDMTTEQLMAQISMVFQDVYLFDDTLRANIAVGREGATEEEIQWAAKLAGVGEIVERLPHGWDSQVGEGGAALSGGERQRVSIARALLKDAPIVLFDEATSALDPENEAHIVAVMQHLRQRATLIVIAHKLGTIQQADQIVVLDPEGTVAQCGTHADLVGQEGRYRAFWEERARAVGWQLAR